MKKALLKYLVLGCMFLFLIALGTPAAADTDSGQVGSGWKVWSCWYFAWVDNLDPNLFDNGEAMYKYDRIDPAANNAQAWEYQNHGPPQNPDDWWGHCHAWSGASVWEAQPTAARTVGSQTFQIRDRKGLMCEAYYNDANGDKYEIYVDNPKPGTFWRWLRKEIKGVNSMHGHRMGFVGELYYGDQVWNYPVYKYVVSYTGNPARGYIKIWVASDADPSYADSTTLYYQTFTYHFRGVKMNGAVPTNTGIWTTTGPYSRPDCFWRPIYPTQWITYKGNPFLLETYLGQILN
jgi:hypothetical protein